MPDMIHVREVEVCYNIDSMILEYDKTNLKEKLLRKKTETRECAQDISFGSPILVI